MLVHIKKDVIRNQSNGPNFALLDKLKIYAAENRHHIVFEDSEELEEWLSQDQAHGMMYKISLMQSARAASRLQSEQKKVIITNNEQCSWDTTHATLTLRDAITVLETPLYVLLENSNNDWHFLLKTLDQSSRKRLKAHFENRWIQPVHGGGSQITQFIREKSQNESDKFRTFCIYDSDRRHPDELNPDWAPVSPQSCQGHTTQQSAAELLTNSHHMLSRRFIESYIPKRELLTCVTPANQSVTVEKINAFFRLSKEGRWFYNMKKGFNGDSKPDNRGREKDIYANISDEDRNTLSQGFGNSIADIYSRDDNTDFEWDDDARAEFSEIIPRILNFL